MTSFSPSLEVTRPITWAAIPNSRAHEIASSAAPAGMHASRRCPMLNTEYISFHGTEPCF